MTEAEHTRERWAWRLPLSRIVLFLSDRSMRMAAMPSGVGLTFTTDTISLGARPSSVDADDNPSRWTWWSTTS
ncbi:hypothetical protein [Jiangella alba]|uniref:hypothetical protein n=1 Tax=Jiangella alba TaxID=561176 RepID=UPI00083EFE80